MQLPLIIYGTAWKEDATAELVLKAITAGFRAIDTANQKKHYREDYLGETLLKLKPLGICREDLFLQSKYTYQNGQDKRMPYDPTTDCYTQVKSSFTNSLKNLHTDYIDSYLLHGPSSSYGLSNQDWEAWSAMEDLQQTGQARMIGISNVNLHQLVALCEKAKIKPKMVQNRCYQVRGWDREVREYCLANQIIYQGFSLLTANPQVVRDNTVAAIAKRLQVTPEQIIFRFAKQIGILPLSGTCDLQHMKDDLDIVNFELSEEDVTMIHETKQPSKKAFPWF